MKYYLHDSNSFSDEKITELYLNFGYEGLGLFYTTLEKLALQEKPIKTNVLKSQLHLKPKSIESKVQQGSGKRLPPLYNDEIEEFFSDRKKYPNFGGVISADEIGSLPKHLPIGFVLNLDPSDKPGSHWVSIYIDGDSINYYDSFGDEPTNQIKNDIQKYLKSMKIPVLLKFKVNKVKDQSPTSFHCGYFAIRFLDEMFRGIPFSVATNFKDNHKEGERVIQEEFDYL